MRNIFNRFSESVTKKVDDNASNCFPVSDEFEKNEEYLKNELDKCDNVVFRQLNVSDKRALLVFTDGLCNTSLINDGIIKPLCRLEDKTFPQISSADFIKEKTCSGADIVELKNLDEVFPFLFSGFCILIIENNDSVLAFGVQGFEKRSISEPFTEVEEKGSGESFTENLTDNLALIRRRIKNPKLKTEIIKAGVSSSTRVAICFLSDRTEPSYVKEVKKRLKDLKIDSLLSSEQLRGALDSDFFSFFSAVGSTERPDVFSSKLSEGRVGIIVDSSPFALYIPFLFIENFHAFDDYAHRAYYALFIRTLRLFCFFASILLPGVYVAVCVYHQQVLSQALLIEIAVQENVTPFSITGEAFAVNIIYEIVREAGLRMPKSVGHAVSIVGALVIGEAAVTAGIISAPMVIIVALTAVGSFVVSKVYESVCILRLLMILVAGVAGFFGLMFFFGLIVINISAMSPYKVPLSSSLVSTGTDILRDSIFRLGWKKLGKRVLQIDRLEK